MRRGALVALLLLAAAQRVPAQVDTDSLAARMRKIADAYVAAYFERHPDEATLEGVAGVRHDQLPDNSPITRGRWQAREDRWLAELQRMDPTPLVGRPEWTAYGVMRASLEGSVATRVCRYEIWNVSHVHRGWLPIVTSLAAVQPVGTEELRAQALARWRGIPLYIASEMANQREGLRLGYSAPQGNVRLVIKQLDQLLDQRLDRSPLYEPALRDSTPAFRDELRRFIENAILPTIRQYRQFLDKEYLPRARKVIGVSANPNGAACYKGAILATTGLTLRRSRFTRPSQDTTSRGRSRWSGVRRFRRSRGTSGRRGSARGGPSTPSGSRTKWGSTRRTPPASARSPTSPSPRRCSSSIQGSTHSAGRVTTGSSFSRRTPACRRFAPKYRWTAIRCGRRRACRMPWVASRSADCARWRSRPWARNS